MGWRGRAPSLCGPPPEQEASEAPAPPQLARLWLLYRMLLLLQYRTLLLLLLLLLRLLLLRLLRRLRLLLQNGFHAIRIPDSYRRPSKLASCLVLRLLRRGWTPERRRTAQGARLSRAAGQTSPHAQLVRKRACNVESR